MERTETCVLSRYILLYYCHMRNIAIFISPRKKPRSEHECQGDHHLSSQTVVHARGSPTRFQNRVLARGRRRPLWVWPWTLYLHFHWVVLLYLFQVLRFCVRFHCNKRWCHSENFLDSCLLHVLGCCPWSKSEDIVARLDLKLPEVLLKLQISASHPQSYICLRNSEEFVISHITPKCTY